MNWPAFAGALGLYLLLVGAAWLVLRRRTNRAGERSTDTPQTPADAEPLVRRSPFAAGAGDTAPARRRPRSHRQRRRS